MNAPVLVVVGRVNKGKSSIVATLAEDESVPISEEPGTTRECRAYSVRLDRKTVLEIIDTPGFQDPAAALAEMRRHESSAADRRAAVEVFIRDHEGTDEFVDERRLLAPILEGGAILYVVDGGVRYARNYEAEMEILRWTGRPRMALVNRIAKRDHTKAWKNALGQYFSVVREFDANRVGFGDRMRLLESFRELSDDLRPQLDATIEALRDERERRRRESARIVSGLLVDALTHRVELPFDRSKEIEGLLPEAERKLTDDLRKMERRAHRRLSELYRYARLSVKRDDLDAETLRQDLFAEKTWKLLGLTHGQMILAGTAAGAGIGAFIDAHAGGASFLAGTLIGGLSGGIAMLYRSRKRLGSLRNVSDYWLQGKRIARFGPVAHVRFPSVLLDRALLLVRMVADRAHSVQDEADLTADERSRSIVRNLSSHDRGRLERLASRIRKKPDDVSDDLRDELRDRVDKILREILST